MNTEEKKNLATQKHIFKFAVGACILIGILKRDIESAFLLSLLLNSMFEFGLVERS